MSRQLESQLEGVPSGLIARSLLTLPRSRSPLRPEAMWQDRKEPEGQTLPLSRFQCMGDSSQRWSSRLKGVKHQTHRPETQGFRSLTEPLFQVLLRSECRSERSVRSAV